MQLLIKSTWLLFLITFAACNATETNETTTEQMSYPAIPVSYPTTAKDTVADDYHGTMVKDDPLPVEFRN